MKNSITGKELRAMLNAEGIRKEDTTMTNEIIYDLTNIMKNVYESLEDSWNDGKPEKEYTIKITTEHTYTISARSNDEAVLRAVRKFDEEGKSDKPIPVTGKVEIINGETTEPEYEDEEEHEPSYYYWFEEENTGVESDCYEDEDELMHDIVNMYRLTKEECEELSEILNNLDYFSNDYGLLSLPYAEIGVHIARSNED